MNLPNLKDKVAVVTGGSGVLCGEFCRVLARCGCKVAIVGISVELGDALEQEIRNEGYEATSFIMNVMDKESIKKCHEEIQGNGYLQGVSRTLPVCRFGRLFFRIESRCPV